MAPAAVTQLLLLAALAASAASGIPVSSATSNASAAHAASIAEGTGDTWAVIVSSSRYWLNYRHSANALGLYQAVRRLGLPDSRILLMLADQPACSLRNLLPGQLFMAPGAADSNTGGSSSSTGGSSSSGGGKSYRESPSNVLPADVELDYRGREVSVDSVLRLLTGRHTAGTPASKRLRSGPTSSVLLYLTGHGGDEFLKFHDQEELLASDLAAAVAQMHAAGRYGQLLLVADTCQASTLYSRLDSPNVLGVASSKLGQSSYAHHIDTTIGQHVVDQFSFYLHQFLTTRMPPHPSWESTSGSSSGNSRSSGSSSGNSRSSGSSSGSSSSSGGPRTGGSSSGGSGSGGDRGPSLQQLLEFIRSQRMSSEVQVRSDLFARSLADVGVTEFFGAANAAAGAAGPALEGPVGADAAAGEESEGCTGNDGGCGSRPSAAARVLLGAAGQQTEQQEAAAVAAPQWQMEQQVPMQLFEILEAAGGSAGSTGLASMAGGQLVAIAAVAGAWAAALLLSYRLLSP